MNCDKNRKAPSGVAGDVLEQLAKGLAQREDFAQIVGTEVRPGDAGVRSLAADLDDADDLVARENRSADQLLDDFGGFASDFYAFENGGVADAGEIVDDIRTALARGTRSDGRGAGKRDEADLFQRLGNEEVEVAPAGRNAHEGHFVGPHAEIFCDA